MSEQTATTTGGGKIRGLFKAITAATVGLGGGVFATYATSIVDRVAKPNKPIANFSVDVNGLSVTCQNHATGDSGWWDFGDGSPLEPFAPEQPITHTYKKAAAYTVKLTVNNFLSDEAERTAPVDLTTDAPQAATPSVSVNVAAVNPVAPATFRITGEVANTEKVIWDLGDGKTEVTTETGPFSKLVVYEKEGRFPIQVIGLAGKTAIKKDSTVDVVAPAAGSLSVVLRIMDTASNGVPEEFTDRVRVPVPPNGAVTSPGFEVIFQARQNLKIIDSVIRKINSPAVKNVQAQIAPDKGSVKITGEWTLTGDALVKAANNGRSVLIPLDTVQERATDWRNPSHWSKMMTQSGSQMWAAMDMPPMPERMANIQRRMQMEIRQTTADGKGQTLLTVPDVKLPWSGTVPPLPGLSSGGTATATIEGNQLKVLISPAGAGLMPASAIVTQAQPPAQFTPSIAPSAPVPAQPAVMPIVSQTLSPTPVPAPAVAPAPPAHLPLRSYTVPTGIQQFRQPK